MPKFIGFILKSNFKKKAGRRRKNPNSRKRKRKNLLSCKEQ